MIIPAAPQLRHARLPRLLMLPHARDTMEEGEPAAKKIRVESPADTQPKKPLGLGNVKYLIMHPPHLLSLCQVCHHFDPPPLPPDWVAVPHVSGATVYLHRPTRVVTLSRPYHVSTSNAIKVG